MEAGGEGLDEEEGVVWWCVMIVEYLCIEMHLISLLMTPFAQPVQG